MNNDYCSSYVVIMTPLSNYLESTYSREKDFGHKKISVYDVLLNIFLLCQACVQNSSCEKSYFAEIEQYPGDMRMKNMRTFAHIFSTLMY